MPRNTNITLRKGTSAEWSAANPILDNGEPGYDTTNKKLKVGDGTTAWNSLQYEGSVSPNIEGVLSIPAGSASAPPLTFTSDNNTGIFSPTSDTVAISTAGSERLRVTPNGRLLIGSTNSRSAGPADPPFLQMEGSVTAGSASIQQVVGSTTATVSPQLLLARHRGVVGESTLVVDGDSLGMIRFNGGDGSDLISTAAQIECFVDGTPGNNDMPGRLIFSTASDGSASATERMRINSSGNIGIGTNSPSHRLDVAGSIRTRSGAVGHQDSGCYIAYPGGGSLRNITAVVTGYLKITLPVSWTSTMLQFGVDIFEYAAQKNKTFRIAGYNWTGATGWIAESAIMDSDNDFGKYRVHFGHDGTRCAIYISKIDANNTDSGAATTWDYPQVCIKDIFASFSSDSMANWAEGWSISFTTTIGTLTGTVDVSRPYKQHDTSYVFNEYGANIDLRIEGDTDTNLFFTDASSDRIGIGTNIPAQKLDITTTSSLLAGFNKIPSTGPAAISDYQSLIVKEQSDSIIEEHYENTSNGSSTLVLKNLIRYGTDFISIDGAYTGTLSFTYAPKLKVNTSTGAITFNNIYTFPTTDGTNGQVLSTNGSGSLSWTTPTSASSTIDISTCNGRLTLTSGNPIGLDTTGSTIYFTPYNGNRIALYDGSSWSLYTFSELSISATGSNPNTNWDIFIYNNSGTLTLERVVWTNNSTRSTVLAQQDGIYVMSGSPTKRYLGTFRTDATLGPVTQTANTSHQRLLWNAYNQIQRIMMTTYIATHTYATETWRPWNNNTTIGSGRHHYVLGLPSVVTVSGGGQFIYGYISCSIDNTTSPGSTNIHTGSTTEAISAEGSRSSFLDIGYHYSQAMEYGVSASSSFFNIIIQTNFLG